MLIMKTACNYCFFPFLCLTFYFGNIFVGIYELTHLPIKRIFSPQFLIILLPKVKRNEKNILFLFLITFVTKNLPKILICKYK